MTRYFLFITFFIIAGCGNSVNENINKQVFRYNETSSITSLDPAFAKDQANIWAVNQLYNGLVQFDDSLNIIPCISKKWLIEDNGLTYIFFLRNDVFFQGHSVFPGNKGRKVIAHDFVYSFNRIISKKVASPGAWIFNDKVTLPEQRVASPWGGEKHLIPFEAINDTTLRINLVKPFPPMLGLLCMQYCSVVPFEAVEHFGNEFRNNPVGTGPFIFKTWSENISLIFIKNENYFETDLGFRLPYLDAVQISFIPDKQTAFFEFLKGDLDFFSGVDQSYKDELFSKNGSVQPKYRERFKVSFNPYLNTEYLGILVNIKNNKLKDSPLKFKKVRQAINYGFDRKKMMIFLRNNIGIAANAGMIPPGIPTFNADKVKGYYFAPDTALKLLAEAGFPKGKGLPVITLSTNQSYLDLCEFLQGQLQEIGIRINIEVLPPATLRQFRDKAELAFFRSSWIADYADAENYMALFYSKNFSPDGPNFTHFYNEKFDKLYETASIEIDQNKRNELFYQMDQIIMDEAPVVVLYYDKVARLYQNNVQGIGNNAMNLLNLKRVNFQ